jgi:hypothetical protein
MVAAAKKQVESLRSQGHADAERGLAAIRAEVERVTKRRDGIVAQLAALKDVVAGFGQDADEETDTAPGTGGDDSGE